METFSSFLELPPLPLRFLLCCYSISLDLAISSLSLLLENMPPCCSLIRPLSQRSNSHQAYFCQCDGYLTGVSLYSLNSLCFLTVAKFSPNQQCFYYFPMKDSLAVEEWLWSGCVGGSMVSPPKNLLNLRAWICFSYLARVICSVRSMRELTSSNFFSTDCNCCSRSSSLQRRQKFWLKMRMRSLRRSYTSVVIAVIKRGNCLSS